MNEPLPEGVEYVRTTDVFDQDHHPGGLLRAHQVAERVWARLLVHNGAMTFVFEDDADRPIVLTAADSQLIPPGRRHHVEMTGPVSFVLEFYRERDAVAVPEGDESTGLAES